MRTLFIIANLAVVLPWLPSPGNRESHGPIDAQRGANLIQSLLKRRR